MHESVPSNQHELSDFLYLWISIHAPNLIFHAQSGRLYAFHALQAFNFALPKIRHNLCQLYLSRACLHVAYRNTRANGANFVVNHHKTRVNTLKSYSLHSLILAGCGDNCIAI